MGLEDMSVVFAKHGGLECLLGFITSPIIESEVKILAASTLSTMGQNNPAVQDLALSKGIIDQLMDLIPTIDQDRLLAKVRHHYVPYLQWLMACLPSFSWPYRVSFEGMFPRKNASSIKTDPPCFTNR